MDKKYHFEIICVLSLFSLIFLLCLLGQGRESKTNNTQKPCNTENTIQEEIDDSIDEEEATTETQSLEDTELKEEPQVIQEEKDVENHVEQEANSPKEYVDVEDNVTTEVANSGGIYEVFSQSELELLFRIVETEVRGDTHFNAKVNVCSVIFNRLNGGKYGSLTNVLTAKSQFSSYSSGAYKKVTITETTKRACEYAYLNGDSTGGALYFDSTSGNSWAAKNRPFLFRDEVGHNFYS